jgi:chemotaxis protein histidine kinase CheA
MTTEKILSSYTIAQLKREISKTNIKGYSKMKRAELHAIIMKNKERFSHLKEQEKKKPAPKAKAKPKTKPPTNKPKPAPKPKPKPKPKTPTPKPKTPPPKTPPSELDELKKKFKSFSAKQQKPWKEQIKKKNFKMMGQEMSEVDYYKQIIQFTEGFEEDKKKYEAEKVKKKAEKEAKKAATAKKKAEQAAKKAAEPPPPLFQAASSVPLKEGDYVPKAVKPLAEFDKNAVAYQHTNFTIGLRYSFPYTDYAIPNPNYVPSNVQDFSNTYFGEPILPPPPGAKLFQPQPKYYKEDTGTYKKTILGPYAVPFVFTEFMKNKGLIYLGKAEMPSYEFYKQYTGNAQHQYKKDWFGAKQVQFLKRIRFQGKKKKPELLVWTDGNNLFTRVEEFQYYRTQFSEGLSLQSTNSNPKMAEFKSWLFTLK